jgi:hypothetical protein
MMAASTDKIAMRISTGLFLRLAKGNVRREMGAMDQAKKEMK